MTSRRSGPAVGAATAWLARTVVLGRAAVAVAAALAPARAEVGGAVVLLGLVAAVCAVELALLSRATDLVTDPRGAHVLLTVDALGLLGLLAVTGEALPHHALTAGWACLAGVLLRPAPAALLTLAAAVQSAVVAAAAAGRPSTSLPGFTVDALAPVLVVACGAAGAVVAARVRREVVSTARLIDVVERDAAAAERLRLARELHDSVGKTLRAITLAAGALPQSVQQRPDAAEALAEVIRSSASTATQEARRLISGLRLDQPDHGFDEVVDEVCRAWSVESGVPVRVRAEPVDLAVAVRYEAVRVLGEALSNTARHARATAVDVTVESLRATCRLAVADDGAGFEVPPHPGMLLARGHAGLAGMHERARSVGGRLDVRSRPGRGTVVVLTVPR